MLALNEEPLLSEQVRFQFARLGSSLAEKLTNQQLREQMGQLSQRVQQTEEAQNQLHQVHEQWHNCQAQLRQVQSELEQSQVQVSQVEQELEQLHFPMKLGKSPNLNYSKHRKAGKKRIRSFKRWKVVNFGNCGNGG